jgi:hypothetical protein
LSEFPARRVQNWDWQAVSKLKFDVAIVVDVVDELVHVLIHFLHHSLDDVGVPRV